MLKIWTHVENLYLKLLNTNFQRMPRFLTLIREFSEPSPSAISGKKSKNITDDVKITECMHLAIKKLYESYNMSHTN